MKNQDHKQSSFSNAFNYCKKPIKEHLRNNLTVEKIVSKFLNEGEFDKYF